MKKLMHVVAFFLLIVMFSCGDGGNSSNSGQVDASVNPSESPEGSPIIDSITGTGSDSVVLDSLNVKGSNFEAGMDVYLVKSSKTINLDYTLLDATEFKAMLPQDIEATDYELNIKNSLGKTTAPLSLLRGEPGISLAHYYSCNGSSDFDDSNDQYEALDAQVYEFSDGSYFMSCTSLRYIYNWVDADTSSAVTFLPANLAESMGYISCIPMYVFADYYFDSNQVVYKYYSETQTVSCDMIY